MDFEAEIIKQYPWLSQQDARRFVNRAKMFYYDILYPTNREVDEETHPIKGFRNEQWILTACEELIDRQGFSSAVAYKENGISWTFDNAYLSQSLRDSLVSIVGVFE